MRAQLLCAETCPCLSTNIHTSRITTSCRTLLRPSSRRSTLSINLYGGAASAYPTGPFAVAVALVSVLKSQCDLGAESGTTRRRPCRTKRTRRVYSTNVALPLPFPPALTLILKSQGDLGAESGATCSSTARARPGYLASHGHNICYLS